MNKIQSERWIDTEPSVKELQKIKRFGKQRAICLAMQNDVESQSILHSHGVLLRVDQGVDDDDSPASIESVIDGFLVAIAIHH